MLQQSVSAESPSRSPNSKSGDTPSPDQPTSFSYDEAFEASVEYFKGDTFAANVWVSKYALQAARKSDGSPAEYLEKTPDDMHRRLAKEFARIEARYPNPMSEDEIFALFKDFRYVVPQGSPMSGIGNRRQVQSLSNCFIAGTPVLTDTGVKNIEDIQVGDRVVTHAGRVQEVLQTHQNELGDRQLFAVKAFRTPEFTVTGNHNFWSVTEEQLGWGEGPQWNSIEHLRKGDWIAIPNNQDVLDEVSTLDIASLLGDLEFQPDYLSYTFETTDETVTMTSHWDQRSRAGNVFQAQKDSQPVRRFWAQDQAFARFLGLWFGDGCVFSQDKQSARVRGITFTFGAHEKELIGFVAEYGQQLFGISADVNDHNVEVDGSVQVVFYSGLIGRVFENLWGRSFSAKKFSPSLFSWDKRRFEAMLTGLVESDGTVTSSGDVRVVMGNDELIDSFYHMARSFGIPLGRSYGTAKYQGKTRRYARLDFPKHTRYLDSVQKHYEDDRIERARLKPESTVKLREFEGCTFVRLDRKVKASSESGLVYTFGVAEDHSYSVCGVVAQNCFVIEAPEDSYAGIMHVDQRQSQIMKRRGGVGFDISTLRPKGLPTANAAVTTDGIGVFMERFSNTTKEVAMQGRRGALMLTCDVHHPEIRTFTTRKNELTHCKKCGHGERTKVTGANVSVRLSDEFLEAVEKGEEYQLRWPVDAEKPTIEEWVDAGEVWDLIMESAHKAAEPGLLFWDHARRMTPSDIYSDEGFTSSSTNPCMTGDTLVAVADGRGLVSFSDLAEEGKDVPVYCCGPNGKVAVRTMRNPRITGKGSKIVKLTLDDGTEIKVTPNHKMLTARGEYVSAQDLSVGESLHLAKKKLQPFKKGGSEYWWLHSWKEGGRGKTEHRLVWEHEHKQEVPEEHVIHHVDYDSTNNEVSNLRCMTKEDHDALHREDKLGSKNPIFKVIADPEANRKWRENLSRACSGTANGNSSGISNTELLSSVSNWIGALGYIPTTNQYLEEAQNRSDWPQILVDFRKEDLLSLGNLVLLAAKQAGVSERKFATTSQDPEVRLQYYRSLTDLPLVVDGDQILVVKTCETCEKSFSAPVHRREAGFCSHACVVAQPGFEENRVAAIQAHWKEKIAGRKLRQLDVFTKLRLQLGRNPKQKEWEKECKAQSLPYRVGRTLKNGFKSYTELKEAAQDHNHRIVSIESVENADVYNGTVDEVHNFYTAGKSTVQKGREVIPLFNSKNCGEIILSPGDSCRLSVCNLTAFVENPFSEKPIYNWAKYGEIVQKAQRLMDDLIDLEIEQVDKILAKIVADPESEEVKAIELAMWQEIREAAVNGRRTGLGITGLGDTIAMMNLKYGTPESLDFVEEIYKHLAINSYTSSIKMAEERGAFPVCDVSKEEGHVFLERIFAELPADVVATYREHGRRNIANTTTAPTGSVSILTQTTSGIEPAFALTYMRRKKVNPDDANARIDSTDGTGDSWQHFQILHHAFATWCQVTGRDFDEVLDRIQSGDMSDIEASPYYGAMANDIDWEARVDGQGRAQKWICHAISSTVNLPRGTDVETVKKVYMKGWKSGCKGITLYVEGSRDGVLLREPDSTDTFSYHDAPKRSEKLECDVHHSRVKRGDEYMNWVFLVGKLEGKPYEIFGGFSEEIELSKKVKSGWIVKRSLKGGGKYDFHYGDEEDPHKIKDVVKVFDNPDQGVFTRIVSTSLRHGTPAQYLVEQLLRERDADMFTFAKGMARVLKGYIPDGAKAGRKKCPECEAEGSLVYQEGCVSCTACGHSKCG